ncbi:MAG: aminotransferase class I/II-fold pyridoxal phosphate-dependent enzyme [Oscillospiraceae bacterium]|nr:aminotransferase class I/II-fold pyridoxal phosphate-dependent enzyme [Oscillospiraceae bacterium]
MKKYSEMTPEELIEEKSLIEKRYEEKKSLGLKLDISRGKPCPEQLNLSLPMLDLINSETESFKCENGFDIRNYGLVEGIPEVRRLFGEILDAPMENVIVTGNSSLNLFYDLIAHAMCHGLPGGKSPWCECKERKLLCPAPGYDRHFAVGELFGFELITIPMNSDGPDMDMVEELIKDETVKGIICVPKYSNPQGISYSAEVVERFAKLSPAAADFRIFWDNAYTVHHLDFNGETDEIPSLLRLAEENGKGDMVYMLASTSKITFPTAGLAAVASSTANTADIKKILSFQNIGPDKINQLRHVLFFKNLDGVLNHMKKQADVIRPKFDTVLAVLKAELSESGIAGWNVPKGGYFVSAELMEGTAKRTVALCKEAGLVLTGAGAVYPYGKDPKDSILRIAPTFAPVSELPDAMEIFCLSAKLAAIEKLLG